MLLWTRQWMMHCNICTSEFAAQDDAVRRLLANFTRRCEFAMRGVFKSQCEIEEVEQLLIRYACKHHTNVLQASNEVI